MQLELTQIIKQEIEITKDFKSTYTIFDLNDLIFLCNCLHLDSGHKLLKEECSYLNCSCKKFEQRDFEFKVFITEADIFSYENPDLIVDSPQWWLKLGEKLNDF